jgi:septation ring formation regulator EzrA
MTDPCKLYKSQFKRAVETLNVLKINQEQINFKLKTNPICADLHKELRNVDLEIKITKNEIEQAEIDIKSCEIEYQSML